MQCPECDTECEPEFNVQKGSHREYVCSVCGQLLQWDELAGPETSGRLMSSPPQECTHPEYKKPDARVPLP
jgi:hypothetical protein